MKRFTVALLLVLLAASPLASVAGVGGSAPPLAADGTDASTADRRGTTDSLSANNTTRRLGLDAVERSDYTEPGMDLASTVAVTGQQLDRGLGFEYLSVRTERVGSAEQRRAIADAEVERLNRSINELRDREWGAFRAYGNGEIGERELLHRLAVIHSNAAQLERAIAQLEADGADFPASRWTLRVEEYQTPIRSQVLDAVSGSVDSSVRVHVAGSSQGVVLQSLSESRFSRDYYREAVRFDNFEQGSNGFDLNDFLDLINERYPFVTEDNSERPPLEGTSEGIGIYQKNHDQGSIRLYNDGRTEGVYREYQSLRLTELPAGTVHSRTSNGTTVSVRETPNGGPARVVATNALDGDPVTVQLSVDGQPVGRTDGSGTLWILQPSEAYTVSARTPEGIINVSVSP